MEKKDKELLLKDLCARLPYGVKCEVVKRSIDGEMLFIRNGSTALDLTVDNVKGLVTNNMYEIKPYLFPLSSMTEEGRIAIGNEFAYGQPHKAMDILHKRHIDYRGLIPKGLAIDARGKNIY